MPPYRLLAIDIDGTLLNSREEVTPATRDALRRAIDNGIHVVLATGRRYSRVLPYVELLSLEVPVVTCAGALIKHPADHRTLFQADFDAALLRTALATVDEAGYESILCGDTFHQGFDFYCRRVEVEQPELAEFYSMNADCHRLWPALVTDPPQGVFAAFAIGKRDQMLALHVRLQDRLPGRLNTHVLRSPRYTGWMCEIAPAGVTKWSGIQHLARGWGISSKEICAVGDDVNDIPMIEAAGLGVAMGNAQAEVKAAADRIAPKHDEEGLAQVVEWLLE
jgi:5-amino-6-(5-phospho-D-ribitylamino)uracil phosphatase